MNLAEYNSALNVMLLHILAQHVYLLLLQMMMEQLVFVLWDKLQMDKEDVHHVWLIIALHVQHQHNYCVIPVILYSS